MVAEIGATEGDEDSSSLSVLWHNARIQGEVRTHRIQAEERDLFSACLDGLLEPISISPGETLAAWLSDTRAVNELRSAARLSYVRAISAPPAGRCAEVERPTVGTATGIGDGQGKVPKAVSQTRAAWENNGVEMGTTLQTGSYQLHSSHASVRFAAFCRLGVLCLANRRGEQAAAAYRFAIAAADEATTFICPNILADGFHDNDNEFVPSHPASPASTSVRQVITPSEIGMVEFQGAYQGLGDASMLRGQFGHAVRAYAKETLVNPSDI